jgi:YD repeat-containing protein
VILSFGRDATSGELTSLTAPWGTTTMAYDEVGTVASVTDPAGGVFSLTYDPMGRLVGLARPNGVADILAYDPAGELLSRTSGKAGVTVDRLAYTYDTAGRRDSRTDAAGLYTYTYDDADRLTGAVHPAGFGIGPSPSPMIRSATARAAAPPTTRPIGSSPTPPSPTPSMPKATSPPRPSGPAARSPPIPGMPSTSCARSALPTAP